MLKSIAFFLLLISPAISRAEVEPLSTPSPNVGTISPAAINVSTLTVDTNTLATSAGKVGIGTASPATTLDVNGSAQFGSGATKSTFTATGDLNVGGVIGQNIGNFLAAVDGSAIFVSSTGGGSWYFAGSQNEANFNISSNKNATSGVTAVAPPKLNLFGRRWTGAASAGVAGSFNLAPNATAADSVIGFGFNDVDLQMIRAYHDSRVAISTLTATYTGGSAYVCVTDAGFIFASEAACP